MANKGLLIVVSGPSGTGKGTVCDLWRKEYPDIHYSVSATTRKPREGEQDGINYYFHTRESFEKMISAGSSMQMGLAFAGLLVVGAMAMAMYELFSWVEKRTTGWAHRGSNNH